MFYERVDSDVNLCVYCSVEIDKTKRCVCM